MLKRNQKYHKSFPWLPGEYYSVNGIPCIYSLTQPQNEVMIHLPGRVSRLLRDLIVMGYKIGYPTDKRDFRHGYV